MPSSFLPRPLLRICPCLSLPHISYFLTISSYLHHHILCSLLRFYRQNCRLSSVPLQRALSPSSGRVYSIQYVDYHPSLRRCVFLRPLTVGFCHHRMCPFCLVM